MADTNAVDELLIDDWLTYMGMVRGCSRRTVDSYRGALVRLLTYLRKGGKTLVQADAVDLETFCGLYLHKQGVIAQSRKPYISAVRGFYNWLTTNKRIPANTAARLEHPITGRPLPRAMTLTNAERLMWAPDMNTFIGIRDAAMLGLLIGCGLRVGGLTALNQGDLQVMEIDREQRMALRTTEKGDKTRILPIPRETEMLIRVYLGHEELARIDRHIKNARGQPDQVLFVSVRSTRHKAHEHRGENRRLTRKAVHDLVQRYGKRLGIPASELHPHAMRHLFGTELQEEDTPTLAMQELLGHADPKSTAVYVRLALRKKAKTIDQAGPMAKMNTPVSELLKRLNK
jgi:site-specific recombinase XerD